MIKQYIVKDDLTLVDAREVGIWKVFNDLVNNTAREAAENEDEHIDVNELCVRFKWARQTVYNKKRSGVWIEGVHYIKPSGGKLLFKWAAIKAWAEKQQSVSTRRNPSPNKQPTDHVQTETRPTSIPSQGASNKDYVNI